MEYMQWCIWLPTGVQISQVCYQGSLLELCSSAKENNYPYRNSDYYVICNLGSLLELYFQPRKSINLKVIQIPYFVIKALFLSFVLQPRKTIILTEIQITNFVIEALFLSFVFQTRQTIIQPINK